MEETGAEDIDSRDEDVREDVAAEDDILAEQCLETSLCDDRGEEPALKGTECDNLEDGDERSKDEARHEETHVDDDSAGRGGVFGADRTVVEGKEHDADIEAENEGDTEEIEADLISVVLDDEDVVDSFLAKLSGFADDETEAHGCWIL